MNNTFLNLYYKIYLTPESMVTFVSGIFISVSTGILTCAIPNSLITIGSCYIISAILMFFASLSLMMWAIFIKPIHDTFYRDPFKGPDGDNDWVAFIMLPSRKKQMKKIHFCFIIAVVSLIVSILLWVIA